MTAWNERPQVIFGNIGEEIVRSINGFYGLHDVLQKGDRPSAVDFVFADPNGNIVEIAEVKTKKATFSWDGCADAYTIANEQFKRNYKPFLKWKLDVPFRLYVVDAEQGKVYSQRLDRLETKVELENHQWCGGCHKFPFRAKSGFYVDGEKILLRYYAVWQFGNPEFEFWDNDELYTRLQEAAARVTVDTIDNSHDYERSDFISAKDIAKLVKRKLKA